MKIVLVGSITIVVGRRPLTIVSEGIGKSRSEKSEGSLFLTEDGNDKDQRKESE
jgi:hypothetical protein